MFKKTVRTLTRSALKTTRRARRYIRQLEEEPIAERDHDQDDIAYPWLNSVFTKILREGGGTLRSNYTWGVLHSAHLAKSIGINRVSVIEFGVAGGNGLVSLEKIAEKVEEILGIGIDVYGFDTGIGLPKPDDYRDLPNLYVEGAYPMDHEKLRRHLKKAQLILGSVESTVPTFINSNPSPVAFVSIDLDYYSSTMQAFQLFEADEGVLLPRIHCYFDDILGFTCSEYNGERLAISEFNACHSTRKISPIYGLKHFLPESHARAVWAEMFFLAHIFGHKLYGCSDGLVKRPFDGGTELAAN